MKKPTCLPHLTVTEDAAPFSSSSLVMLYYCATHRQLPCCWKIFAVCMGSQLSNVKSMTKICWFHLLRYLLYLGFSTLVILVFYLNCIYSCYIIFLIISSFPLLPQSPFLVLNSCCVPAWSDCFPTSEEMQAMFQSEVSGSLRRERSCRAVNYWCTLFIVVVLPDLAVRTTWFNPCHFIEGEYSDLPPGCTGVDLSVALCVISAEQTVSAEAAWRILKPAYHL